MIPQPPPAYNTVTSTPQGFPATGNTAATVSGGIYSYQRAPLVYNNFPSYRALRLAVAQVVIGAICIIFNSVTIGYNSDISKASCGIWGGATFIITGVFGICASKSTGKCAVMMFTLTCITSAVMTVPLFTVSVVGAVESGNYNCHWYYCSNNGVVTALLSLMAVLAVAEAVVSMWGAVLGCRVACSCCDNVPEFLLKFWRAPGESSQMTMGQYEPVKIPYQQTADYTGIPPAFPSTPSLPSAVMVNEGTPRQPNSPKPAGAGGDNIGYSEQAGDPEKY